MDDLAASARYCYAYRESSVLCFTETWLLEGICDGCAGLDGFTLIRIDKSADSGSQSGGGACMYLNNRWTNNWTIKG